MIDIAAEAAKHEPWFNQTLTSVYDAVVRLRVIEGDFHRHKHDEEDEFFLVLEGELVIEIEGSDTVRLRPHQGYTAPMGVTHRTSAPSEPSSSRSSQPESCPQVTEPAFKRWRGSSDPRRDALLGSVA